MSYITNSESLGKKTGNYIHVGTKTKNNKNYFNQQLARQSTPCRAQEEQLELLLKDNRDNFTPEGEDNLDKQRDFYFCCIASCLLRVYNGFILCDYYEITMRFVLLCLSLLYPFSNPLRWYRGGIGNDKYKYENFPHLTVCDFISHTTPDNISLSSFMVYNTDWEKTVYSFDNVSDLRTLPAGDYIIVGIENERIPFDKPHYMIGEYDYKSDKSAIIFGLTVLEEIEQTSTLSYLMFIPELEDVDENTMLDIKKAWKEYWYNDWYSIYYLMSSYTDQDAARLAAEHAQQKAEEAYTQLFNSEYFDSYGYLGTFGDIIVISAYSLIDNSQLTIDIPQPITDYYVYYEGKIYTHSSALITSIIFEDQIKIFIERNTKYLECINNYNSDQSE